MDERVACAERQGANHAGALCMGDGIKRRRHVDVGDRSERRSQELVPEHGSDRYERTRRLVERGELPEHNGANTGRNGVGVAMSCGLCDGADVEGVAAAGVPHPVEQQLVGLFAQHHRQQLTDVPVGQRPDLYSSGESSQLGEIGSTRLVGGSQRGDHEQRAARRRGGDVGEGLQRRRVGPLQVVDDHHSRGCPRRRRHSDRELVEDDETVRRDRRVAWG